MERQLYVFKTLIDSTPTNIICEKDDDGNYYEYSSGIPMTKYDGFNSKSLKPMNEFSAEDFRTLPLEKDENILGDRKK